MSERYVAKIIPADTTYWFNRVGEWTVVDTHEEHPWCSRTGFTCTFGTQEQCETDATLRNYNEALKVMTRGTKAEGL